MRELDTFEISKRSEHKGSKIGGKIVECKNVCTRVGEGEGRLQVVCHHQEKLQERPPSGKTSKGGPSLCKRTRSGTPKSILIINCCISGETSSIFLSERIRTKGGRKKKKELAANIRERFCSFPRKNMFILDARNSSFQGICLPSPGSRETLEKKVGEEKPVTELKPTSQGKEKTRRKSSIHDVNIGLVEGSHAAIAREVLVIEHRLRVADFRVLLRTSAR